MQQKLVIIGAGFAGMWSALAPMRLIDINGGDTAGIEVTVVAPEPRLVLRPRLYEANSANMSAPLSDLFHVTGVQFVKGTVDTILTAQRRVEIVDPSGARSFLSYDRLILADGSRLVRPDIPGLRDHAFSIDRIEEAMELETHLQSLASLPPSPARNTIIVGGGGFTGIEIGAELPERLRSILGNGADVRVVIVERADEIGPDLGPGPRPVITQALTELGVEMRLGAAITSIDEGGVITASGERIEARTVVWTAGLEATVLGQYIDGEKDKHGRVRVDRDLRVPSAKDIFVTGDAACAATDEKDHHTLMSCQHALRLGRSAGHNAAADLLNLETQPYSQASYVTCLDLGPWGAIVTEGWDRKVRLSGFPGKPIKQNINGALIYPPKASRVEALAAASPAFSGPTLA